MKINVIAAQLIENCRKPGAVLLLADRLRQEHGEKEPVADSVLQCRVKLLRPNPDICIRDNLYPATLEFVLNLLLADRPVSDQNMQAYVMDLNGGHTLYLRLFSNYAERLHSFLDHGIVIEES